MADSTRNWEEFVQAFVSSVDYDLGKELDIATAEDPDEVCNWLDELVCDAKRYAKEYLGVDE